MYFTSRGKPDPKESKTQDGINIEDGNNEASAKYDEANSKQLEFRPEMNSLQHMGKSPKYRYSACWIVRHISSCK